MSDAQNKKFEEADTEKDVGVVNEFAYLIKHNKKYWMIPLILILLGLGVLIFLGSSTVAPFIYTLF